ncbi:hypothetical protein [Nonomuraea dietziae]|uniref:hypothetical protein n=1 Tax=Nonomuraea dietziae TaxID=65515 RepID=UPI0031E1CC37
MISPRARLIARLNQIMLPVTGRPDVLATMVWGAPDNTPPAWYDPATATITFNADQVILNDAHPDQIDPTHPLRRFDQPVLIGVSAHEGGHARSEWDLKAIRDRSPSPRVMAIATYLLESWAEAGQLRATPGAAPWLRTAARHILQFPPTDPDADEDYKRARALVAALLVLARVDAGVLQPGDTIAVESIVVATLGQPTVDDLRALWQTGSGAGGRRRRRPVRHRAARRRRHGLAGRARRPPRDAGPHLPQRRRRNRLPRRRTDRRQRTWRQRRQPVRRRLRSGWGGHPGRHR